MIRVCPHSDSKCVHGMRCPYTCATDSYDGNKNLMAEQNVSAPGAWRWSRDMTRLPWSQTLLFLDPIDEDGCQQVRLGLSTEAMNAEAWSPLPGESRPTPATPERLREKVADTIADTLGHLIDPAVIRGATLRAADKVLSALQPQAQEGE